MLRVWLCGGLAAEVDGEPLAMPTSARARALPGWLALHPGPAARADLASRLWPDCSDTHARASLRTAIWALRQVWGEPAAAVLTGSRTSFGLRREGLWVDATAEDDRAPPPLGVLLPGVDDDWVDAAREEHRDRQLHRFEVLAGAAEAESRAADAVAWSRQRCLLAPLDEAAHRDLLRRLGAAGERAGALVAAREFSQRLSDELGVTPCAATRAATSELRGGSSAPPRSQLFGRTVELSLLAAAWRSAARGAGQVVVLTGEAGIGKTALLAELAHRVVATGGRAAVGAGNDVGGETPFGAWLDPVRALAATAPRVARGATWPAELGRLTPELGSRLGGTAAPETAPAPEWERLRVFEAVLSLVEWSCTDSPVLLAIDDAHHADRASLGLAAHVGRQLCRLPLLLVLTRRDRPSRGELDALLADLHAHGVRVTEVDVGPIGDQDMAALVTSLRRLDHDDVRNVVAAADGNPLLGVESVSALATGSGTPPPTLRTAVRGALGALSADGRALARLLAVAGRPLGGAELDRLGAARWGDTLLASAGNSTGNSTVDGPPMPDVPPAGAHALHEAERVGVDSGLLARTARGLGFRHAMLRQVVHDDLVDPARLHEQVAMALDPADHPERARHLVAAGRPVEAAAEWTSAAADARSTGALSEAATFLERATECAAAGGHR